MLGTAIAWTDATFNPWWGCARVSRACRRCYAEAFAKRTGHADLWGANGERRLFGDKHWAQPLAWNARAETAGVPLRVFCASMADVFEAHPALRSQRERLWDLIEQTPWLTWQLLTKRPENVMAMAPARWSDGWPRNVWVGTTVEDQEWAEERIPHLLEVPATVRFVSFEPLCGRIDLRPEWIELELQAFGGGHAVCFPRVDWAIVGGESGPGHETLDLDHAAALVDQCQQAGVAVFVKQDSGPRPGQQGRIPDEFWALKEFPAVAA